MGSRIGNQESSSIIDHFSERREEEGILQGRLFLWVPPTRPSILILYVLVERIVLKCAGPTDCTMYEVFLSLACRWLPLSQDDDNRKRKKGE
jgi:hypothetical protein